MKNEQYKYNQCFSITQYLKNCYQTGHKPDSLLIENINWFEKSSKKYAILNKKKEIELISEETLSLNVMKNLPLEAYKDYVNKNWIVNNVNNSKNNVINEMFMTPQFDILFHLQSLHKKETNLENKLDYINNFINPVLNAPHLIHLGYINYSEDDAEKMLILLKSCWQDKLDHLKATGYHFFAQDYEKRHWALGENNAETKLFQLLINIIKQPKLFNLFLDIMGSLDKLYKKNDIINIIYNEKENNFYEGAYALLDAAFSKNNIQFIDFLKNKLKLSQVQLFENYNNYINQSINIFLNNREDNERISNFIKETVGNYKKIQTNFFPEHQHWISLLNNLIKSKEQNIDCNDMPEELKKIFITSKLLNDFLIIHSDDKRKAEITFTFQNTESMSSVFYFCNYLVETHPSLINRINVKNIDDKTWMEVENILNVIPKIGYHLDFKKQDVSKNDFNSWLLNYKINCQLDEKSKKTKIKV